MQTIASAINHSRLYQGCVFHSNERVASHVHVTSALADHDLHWRRGAVDTALFKVRINRLQLMALRYGAQVEISPRPFDDFALVHIPLKGGSPLITGSVLATRRRTTAELLPELDCGRRRACRIRIGLRALPR